MEREGTWKNDQLIEGQQIWPNGAYFIGNFKNGLYHGCEADEQEGELSIPNENLYYVGDFKDGQFQGQGRLEKTNEFVYDGHFIEGRVDGHGMKESFVDGTLYQGEWKQDLMDGQGKLTKKVRDDDDI